MFFKILLPTPFKMVTHAPKDVVCGHRSRDQVSIKSWGCTVKGAYGNIFASIEGKKH